MPWKTGKPGHSRFIFWASGDSVTLSPKTGTVSVSQTLNLDLTAPLTLPCGCTVVQAPPSPQTTLTQTTSAVSVKPIIGATYTTESRSIGRTGGSGGSGGSGTPVPDEIEGENRDIQGLFSWTVTVQSRPS
jgi:hypothetical protein